MASNTDIYNMSEALFDLQKNMMEETDEETLVLGTYGFFNAAISKMIVDNIRITADNANEVFATRAKYDKNIITHAINNGIIDINAKPASIPVLFCLLQSSIDSLFESQGDIITISTECAFYFGDYEYHLDYPILLQKQKIENNKDVYTARYDTTYKNDLSDVTNPFLPSPYIFKMNGNNYIFIPITLRQVERSTVSHKLLTRNIIDNKTYIFTFENQLAGFEVYVKDDDGITIKLTPIFEGTNIPDGTGYYCWYTFIDEDTIRVKFESASFMPDINDNIETVIYTTHGAECNFTYIDTILATLEDTDSGYVYNTTEYMLIPQGDSSGGQHKKSMDELRVLLPKHAQSRGNIINSTDIKNYFSSLSTETVKIEPMKKVDNQIMRIYYLYLLMKDDENIIIPTNTINILFDAEKADYISNLDGNTTQFIYNQGIYIGYNGGYGKVIDESEVGDYEFIYTLPYKVAINTDGPFVSYFMDTMDIKYETFYSYINDESPVQFICQYMEFKRGLIDANYELSLTLTQNINEDYGIVTQDEEGNEHVNIKLIAIAYDSAGLPQRYFKGEYIRCNIDEEESIYSYDFKFVLETEGTIDMFNNIRLSNCYRQGTNINDNVTEVWDSPSNLKLDIYAMVKFENQYSNYGIDNFVKGLEGYSCTNTFTIKDGIDLYQNYTDISNSTADIDSSFNYDNNTNKYTGNFIVKSVPVLKRSYAMNSEKLMKFLNKLNEFKDYINNAVRILEDGFNVDFKYYNTYGISKLYTVDNDKSKNLDRVNLSLNFDIYLKKSSDNYTKNYIIRDIIDAVENFENEPNRHITSIVADIQNKYSNSIYYISFTGMNDGKFDANYQHLYSKDATDLEDVPEFICINRLDDNTPDINIRLAT